MYYNDLLEYCRTERQREVIEALIKNGGNQTKTARVLNISRKTIYEHIRKTEEYKKQALNTPSSYAKSLDDPIPEPQYIKQVSGYYDVETRQAEKVWIKTDTDKELRLKQILENVKDAIQHYEPIKKIVTPKGTNKNTLNLIPFGDPHIGMYSWCKETGEDFDCDIAEKDLRGSVKYLFNKAPNAETCIILNCGDFFHSDNQSNRTARAGNALDVDTRWSRVLRIGIDLMLDCIYMALEKHKKVIVKNNIGNHDDHTSQVLSICLMQAFKNNPRVEIAEPADRFFVYEFGKNMIFSTHGDMVKPKQAQGVLANYYPEVWGRTEHRLAVFGHFHHEQRIEENGLVVEIFNTLASSDAWHHSSGYRSKRNQKLIVLDKELGEVERYTFNLARQPLKAHTD